MLDSVFIRMFTPPDWACIHQHEHQHNYRCTVYFRYITLMFGAELFGWNKQCPPQLYPRCWDIFNKLLCYVNFGHYILFGKAELYGFLDSNLQWLSFKFNLQLLLLHLVGFVLLCHYLCRYVCIVSLRVFACISTWALVYWRYALEMNLRLI